MPQFLYAYKGGERPSTPDEGREIMEAWLKWQNSLGAAIVEPGNPVVMSKMIHKEGVDDNGGSDPLMGYSIVKTESMEQAVAMGKDCPHVTIVDGRIEVAEIKPLP